MNTPDQDFDLFLCVIRVCLVLFAPVALACIALIAWFAAMIAGVLL